MRVFFSLIILPPPTHPPSFLEIKFYFKIVKFYIANQCVPRRHKNKHWSERATSEEYWYALEYKAPLISTSDIIAFSLAAELSGSIVWIPSNT